MAFRLIIENKEAAPGTEPEIRDFDQEIITMGRHSSNDIQIPHNGASRQHCKIFFEDGNYFLIDPGSANGTMLNNRKVPMKRNQLLKDGDIIGVECFNLKFKTMDRVAVKGPGENTDEVALRVVREVLGSLQSKTNPTLEVVSGPNKGRVIEFDKDVQQVIAGRSDNCDLVLNDPMISRRNTKIRRDWSGVTVFDMNSKNGTYVNGKKITEQVLKDGDEVRIGESKIYFRNPKEAFTREFEEAREVSVAGTQEAPPPPSFTIEKNIQESLNPPPVAAAAPPAASMPPAMIPPEPAPRPPAGSGIAEELEGLDDYPPEGGSSWSMMDFIAIGGALVLVAVAIYVMMKFVFN